MDDIEGLNREVQQEEAMQEFQAKQREEAWRRMVHQLRKIAASMIRDWKDALQGDKAASNALNIEESQAAEFCSKTG
ncbi:hypothetical protein PIB30_081806, partial [Stylosanthes scabra]|nr:hypothetical protein [Stylosanthes scabra]